MGGKQVTLLSTENGWVFFSYGDKVYANKVAPNPTLWMLLPPPPDSAIQEAQEGVMDDPISQMLCPFCSAPWLAENIYVWNVDSADQCDSGRFEAPTYSISITCHACKREMYRKEGAHAEYGKP